MYLRPDCTSQYMLLTIEYQDRHYLRISTKGIVANLAETGSFLSEQSSEPGSFE